MSQYSILLAPEEDRYCAITAHPVGMRNTVRPTLGKSMGSSLPEILDLRMSRVLHPSGLQVPDAIMNTLDFLIVSDRLKELIEQHATVPIEYVPCQLFNHKHRLEAQRYYVVNVLGTLSCEDAARSLGVESPFNPGTFFSCERLALDEGRVPQHVNIFRVSLFPPAIFVRTELRAIMEERGMVVRFVDPGSPL